MLAPELSYTHSNAASDGKSEYIEKVGRGVFHYLELARFEEKICVLENTAIFIGRLTGNVRVDGALRQLNNRFTAVWVRRNGKWALAVYLPTPIPIGKKK